MLKCLNCKHTLPRELLWAQEPKCPNCLNPIPRCHNFLSFEQKFSSMEDYSDIKQDTEFLKQEDDASVARFNRYFVPLLRSWQVSLDKRILCLGCGGGADVDTLKASGFKETYGVDFRWRSKWWEMRNRDPRYMFVVDGNGLPFTDYSFDIIISLGVIEHVGAIDSSAELHSDYRERRKYFIAETLRVLRKGGNLIIACPNRLCLFDFQHNISRIKFFSQLAEKTGFSIHSPFDNFLLSYRDILEYAQDVSSGVEMSLLPISNYLGFAFRNSAFLRPMSKIFKIYLAILDKAPNFIRKSFFNPYMFCVLTKNKE